MNIGLILVLTLIFILPFTFRSIEHNLEYFLLAMGIAATIISGTLSLDLIAHIFENYLLYFITAAVLIAGLVFRLSVNKIKKFVSYATQRIPITVFIFLLIVTLGLISSFITAIIAALILVEIVHALPFKHNQKVQLNIIACFSIGLGAVLTPIGEPLSTIVVSSLKVDFFFLFRNIGIYIIPCVLALGLFGAFFIGHKYMVEKSNIEKKENETYKIETENIIEIESLQSVFIRAFKIFLFIIALELLGAGFKPLINTYIIHLDSRILYWINMSSAVLDNATIAAAEVSPVMSLKQIQAILMGLLLSGGMLIPGNIPNIISAGKLNIKSREWAKIGLPLGLVLLLIYFVVIFMI
jgi:predicted cation transporter